MMEDDTENIAPQVPKKKATTGKSIEQIYTKKTQLEHILLRPDTYGKFSLHSTQHYYKT